jgi:hypothetical protein
MDMILGILCAMCGKVCDQEGDLCTACDSLCFNVETPYWKIAGLDDPNEPYYDEKDYDGKQDMFPDWRSRIPVLPVCPRCNSTNTEHMGSSEQEGDEFICQPCGAILYQKGGVLTDTGRTAPLRPIYGDP